MIGRLWRLHNHVIARREGNFLEGDSGEFSGGKGISQLSLLPLSGANFRVADYPGMT